MNSSIRSVIRLKSPSIKLLWLLIYNLYATEQQLPSAISGNGKKRSQKLMPRSGKSEVSARTLFVRRSIPKAIRSTPLDTMMTLMYLRIFTT